MSKQFRNLLQETSQLPLQEQKRKLEQTLDEWKALGNESQTDDILVIGFEPYCLPTSFTICDVALIMAKVFSPLQSVIVPKGLFFWSGLDAGLWHCKVRRVL